MFYSGISRWYNENREKFWRIVIIALLVVFFIQIANNYYKNKPSNVSNTSSVNQSKENLDKINNNISGRVTGTQSLVSGSSVNSSTIEKASSIIDTFLNYCNKEDIELAYNMLTEECRELMYPTLQDFQRIYHKKIYSTPKTYKLQNWTGNTYKVDLLEDALTTGKTGNNIATLQDYITIVDNKININSYIGRTEINKTTTIDKISIDVIYKDTYMDYEIYNLKIKNLSGKKIALDDAQDTKSIYIQDEKDISNYVYSGELNYDNLILENGQVRSLMFKFSNTYSVTRKMKNIVFSRVLKDYNEYIENENKDTEKLIVNI